MGAEGEPPPGPRRGRSVGLLVAVAAVVTTIVLIALPRRAGPPAPTKVDDRGRGCGAGELTLGQRLPEGCRVQMLRGRWTTLGEVQGDKPLVINFWASWCAYCIKEMPGFQRMYTALQGQVGFLGLDLLGVQGETREAAASLARQTGVGYPVGFDEAGVLYFRLAPSLLMPTTVFVRTDGTVAYRQFGPLREDRLRQLVHEQLGI